MSSIAAVPRSLRRIRPEKTVVLAKQAQHAPQCGESVKLNVDLAGDAIPLQLQFIVQSHGRDGIAAAVFANFRGRGVIDRAELERNYRGKPEIIVSDPSQLTE